jgi:nitrile hydratase subunit beta
MNGVHDLGGMHGFGHVEREAREPVFHRPWEKTVFSIMAATMVQRMYNIDQFRYGVERMDPAHYLASSYYEHWLASIETNLIEKGIINRKELEARRRQLRRNRRAALRKRRDPALTEQAMKMVHRGGRYVRDPVPARFKAGDRVRARNLNPQTHTRLPRYARGKTGVVERIHGTFVFPDTNAVGEGESPQPLYSVRFAAPELWGEQANPNHFVYLDMWDSYLEPA